MTYAPYRVLSVRQSLQTVWDELDRRYHWQGDQARVHLPISELASMPKVATLSTNF